MGKYCRNKPLVFSFVPRCHGLCGSQKYTFTFVATVKRLCEANSVPRSHVRDAVNLWVANYYSARNPLRLSSLVILGVVARMFRCATRSSCWCT